ncbi:exopolysaccharide transport family protein [Acuticoccus sp. MNP-M23]|uniref:GumC family protein n=1 Tax=Acuticoccus sp. MNP-M23 TaxID=3072793 RepID=UPI0028165D5A|nr:exopolysaccharide transport family protein [Acuticoccus sp. MNP-M23]WMS43692.1 exopolysaccharide transport family protein [Acuticoccus sp. MNP-M23]
MAVTDNAGNARPPAVPAANPFNPVLWLISALWQYKWLIVAIVAAGVAGATVLASRMPDVYSASGLLEIDPEPNTVLNEQQSSRFVPAETITETEVAVIRSSRVLQQVVAQLNLEFSSANPLLREEAERDMPTDRGAARRAIASNLARNLSVAPTGRSFVVQVSYESEDPDFAAQVVNAVMAEYLGVEVDTARDFSRESVALLSDRLEDLRRTLTEREKAVQEYLRQNRNTEAAGTTALAERLNRLNEQLSLAQAQLASAAATASSSERSDDPAALPEVVASPLIQALRAQEATQAREVDELQTLYKPTHPRLIQARSALAAIRDTIAQETAKIASSLTTSEAVQQQRVLSLEADVEDVRGQLNSQRDAEFELRRLQREADAAKRIYESFLDRFNQVDNTTGFEQAQGRIIASALPPVQPSGPNRLLVLAGGGVLSGALAFMLVIGLALMDRRTRSASDVTRATGLSPVAVMPPVPGRGRGLRGKLFAERRNARFADAISQLRAALLLGAGRDGALVVAITTPDRKSDHAALAVALAQAAAVAGDEVVLVDACFDRPSVHLMLGGVNEYGLSDAVSENGEIEGALQVDGQTALLFIAAGKEADPSLYRAKGMDDVVDELAEAFSRVIVVLPPISDVPDAQALSAIADVTAIVVRAAVTERSELTDLVSQLRYAGYAGKIATVLVDG